MSKPMAFAVDRSRTIISSLIHGRGVYGIDVAWLRREVFADGAVSREAADELFTVARADLAKAPAWTEFFVEMITEHAIWQSSPAGVLDEERAVWLIAQADAARCSEALAALTNVLAEAERVPQWFIGAVRKRAARGWPGVEAALGASLAC